MTETPYIEPASVPLSAVHAAYDALDLDPDLWRDTARIVIEPSHVAVTRYRRNAEGRKYLDPTGRPARIETLVEVTA